MGLVEKSKILAEIAEMGARIYGIIVDKSRAQAEKDAKIRELEAKVTELQKKVK